MFNYDVEHIAHACGSAIRSGSGWLCCCPAHDDRKPSLSLSYSGNTLLAKCHAGCDFIHIIDALKGMGLLDGTGIYSENTSLQSKQPDYSEYALKLWGQSRLASGTLTEIYLRSRGYTGAIPDTLQFHPSLKHRPSGVKHPAMVAGISVYPSHDIVSIHRTYLSHDGKSKAPVESPKMMLGAASGGAVRFGSCEGDTLWVAEGIESALSIFLASGEPVWAALSTSGMKAVELPPVNLLPRLYIAADHDDTGIGAANTLAAREMAIGREVHVAIPPVPGQDFNDVLRGEVYVS